MRFIILIFFLLSFSGNIKAQCNTDMIFCTIYPCNDTTNTFYIDGYIEFVNAPSTGQLIVQDTYSGNFQTFSPPFLSPTNYTIPGITANGQTSYVQASFTDDSGCDILLGPYIAPASCICQSTTDTLNIEICPGDSIFVENGYQFSPGTYYDTIPFGYNCDSVIISNIAFALPIITNETISICSGDSIFLQGYFQFNPGTYYDTINPSIGCDTIIISDLSFFPIIQMTDSVFICQGDSILLQGEFQLNPGIYFDTLVANSGCDSILSSYLEVENCSLVWPGDTDNDSIVTISDFLPIGVYYGLNEFSRDSSSIVWMGHRSRDWSISQNNGINAKHVDCNGDGIINLSDSLATRQNYTFTYNLQNSSSRTEFEMNLLTATTNVFPGSPITVELHIGTISNPTSSIYGIAFESIFSGMNPIEPGSLKLISQNSFLGNLNQDLFGLKYLNEPVGEFALALTRIDHISQSGYGSIAQIQFIIDESVNVPSQFDLIILNNVANDEAGNNSTINNLDTLTFNILDPLTVSRIESDFTVEIFPNPATGEIYFKTESPISQVDVYSIDGKLISNCQFKNGNRQMDVSALPNGSYLMNITSDSSKTIKNLVILK